MGFLARLEKRSSSPENPSTSLANPDAWLAEALGAAPSAAGVVVTEKKAFGMTAVWAAINILAGSIAQLPLPLYRRLQPRGKERVLPAQHPLAKLLKRPNPEITAFEFRELFQSHVLAWGNAYAEIEFNGRGEAIALWPLLPDRTRAFRVNGRRAYVTHLDSGEPVTLSADRVFHLPGLGFDGISGYSPIRLHMQSLGLTSAAEEYGARFFGNASRPSGIISIEGVLKPEATARMRESWERMQQGLSNAHRVAIMEQGAKWQQMGIAPEEAQFIELRRFQLDEVARIFRVPPHMLANLDRATFNNIEHMGLEFVVHSLGPWLKRWEERIDGELLPAAEQEEYFCEHLVAALLRGDLKSRYDAYAVGRNWSWLSVNEIREMENMNPVEGGDEYLQPLNMAALGSAPAALPAVRRNPHAAVATVHRPALVAIATQVRESEASALGRAVKKFSAARDEVKLRAWVDEYAETRASAWAAAVQPACAALWGSLALIGGAPDGFDEAVAAGRTARAIGELEAARLSGDLRAELAQGDPDTLETRLTASAAAWVAGAKAAVSAWPMVATDAQP